VAVVARGPERKKIQLSNEEALAEQDNIGRGGE
jgi:hypothetical protein